MPKRKLAQVLDSGGVTLATSADLDRQGATLEQYFGVIGLEELLAFTRGAQFSNPPETTPSFSESLGRRWP